MSYLFAFSYCSWGSQGKNTEVVCHSLLQWTIFCQLSPPWPVGLGSPHLAWLSLTELDKAVVHVIRLASFLWLWLYSIGPCFHHQSHPQLSVVFALAPSLHSFWSYFSTDLQSHIGHLPTWGVPLSVYIILPFHTVHGILKARILKWFAIPFSSGPYSVRPLHHDPPVLGGPTWHGLVSLS